VTVNVYQRGDLVRVTGIFTDIAGQLIDPTTVRFKATKPSGALLDYTYPTTIVKTSTGNYHVDINADQSGKWLYRWENSGTGQAAEQSCFEVEPSHFVAP
jgi:hypothetical protein